MHADIDLSAESPHLLRASEILSLLGEPTRLQIVLALKDGEFSVNHLADIIDRTPGGTSQHLAKLRLSRIVTSRQEGRLTFYRLAHEHVARLAVDAIMQAQHANEPASSTEGEIAPS